MIATVVGIRAFQKYKIINPVICITEVKTTVQFVNNGCPMAARNGYPRSIDGIVTKQAHIRIRNTSRMFGFAVP